MDQQDTSNSNGSSRAQREAEIAKMIESLDEAPTVTHPPLNTTTASTNGTTTEAESTTTNTKDEEKASKKKKKKKSIVKKLKIPITSSITLPYLSAALSSSLETSSTSNVITTLALDPSGSRLVSGSTDSYVRMYDFGGLDMTGKPFKYTQIQDGHGIRHACFNHTGDKLAIGTTSAQPMILDREGREVIEFIKGDPYVTDMKHTTGHVSTITGLCWHPFDKNTIITSSEDGSARSWDVEHNKTQFQKLCCGPVYRAKDRAGKRTQVTCVAMAPSGREFALGTKCGSIQIWSTGKVGTRPEREVHTAHGEAQGKEEDVSIMSLTYNHDGTRIASRSMISNGDLRVWDARRMSRSAKPLYICQGYRNRYEYSSCAFSPDGRLLCAGTSVEPLQTRKDSSSNSTDPNYFGRIQFYRVDSFLTTTTTVEPVYELNIIRDVSIINVVWHPKLNQIFMSLSDGSIRVCYDNKWSEKGALLAVAKGMKREDDLTKLLVSRAPQGMEGVVGAIRTPNALPIFQDTEKSTKRKREKERQDPNKSKKPEPPATGIKMGVNSSTALSFSQYVHSNKKHTKNVAGRDPREELFKYNTGKVYTKSAAYADDKKVLAEKTVEEEEEDMKDS